ncbi:SHOCT domain-containing protein [Pseudonocardia xinjiangensis]|uniref:SHOCT domain-containing protein n=2 Tax=Pseudonocardia xinjiangensis TaxID=75289 RepID=A0ABX1RB39_9PSEU|nr:SHOCT domain-containing protein [Pseudonocardia xinjiangensis]NMH76325.1 SHOCT domain-containing protein [Pseudonocardia xinjiangensis]
MTGAVLRTAQTQILGGRPVGFTLGQAKALIPRQDVTGLAGQVVNLIPNDVGFTVLTPQEAPRIYTTIDVLKSLWLWVGLAALGILAGALAVSRQRLRTLRAWAVTTGVIALLLAFSLVLIRGPLLSGVQPANVEVANAVYDGVTASLRSWTLWLVLIMAGITAVTLLWGRIGLVPAIRRARHAARARGAEDRAVAVAAPADGSEAVGQKPPSWPKRVADETRAFVAGLTLQEQLARLAGFLRRNLRAARWAGVAVGALVLLLWPGPTLSVLIWVVACVALYIGLIELVLAGGARSEGASDAEAGRVPVATNGGATADGATDPAAVVPAPAVRAGADGEHTPVAATGAAAATPPAGRPMTQEGISAMSSKLDVLMRLGDARTAGVLTEEEFTSQKTQLLSH